MNRRTFTFASLALAVTARASDSPSQNAVGTAPAEPAFRAIWRHAFVEGALVIGLKATNQSKEQQSVYVARGSQPITAVQAFVAGPDEIELARIQPEVTRGEIMTRMGPVQRWEDVAVGGEVDLGEFKFTLPQGAEREAFRVTASMYASDGESNGQTAFTYTIAAGDPTPA